MAKYRRPLSIEQAKAAQARQARREFSDKFWSIIVIGILGVIVSYSLYLQVLHHL